MITISTLRTIQALTKTTTASVSSLTRYSKPLPVFNLGVSSLQGEVERLKRAKKISNLLVGAMIATAKNGDFFRRPTLPVGIVGTLPCPLAPSMLAYKIW